MKDYQAEVSGFLFENQSLYVELKTIFILSCQFYVLYDFYKLSASGANPDVSNLAVKNFRGHNHQRIIGQLLSFSMRRLISIGIRCVVNFREYKPDL